MNFTVTRGSLQSQCLNQVLKAERPDVDAKRSDLLKLQGEFLLRLRHLEKSLLQALNDAKGHILDDDRWAGFGDKYSLLVRICGTVLPLKKSNSFIYASSVQCSVVLNALGIHH